MSKATVTFANGKSKNFDVNGNCLIANAKPSLPDDLSTVTVESEGWSQTFLNAFVIECASVDGKYWFTFGEEDPAEAARREEFAMLEDAIMELAEMLGGE